MYAIDPKRTAIFHSTLRRLAQRALKVLARHREHHEAISAFEHAFVPLATEYMKALDEAHGPVARHAAGLLERHATTVIAAEDESDEAQDRLIAYLEGQGIVRRKAVELQEGLVELRQALRAVLGRSHRDYQKLRTVEATTLDDEDEEVIRGEGRTGDLVVPPRSNSVIVEDQDEEDGYAPGESHARCGERVDPR